MCNVYVLEIRIRHIFPADPDPFHTDPTMQRELFVNVSDNRISEYGAFFKVYLMEQGYNFFFSDFFMRITGM